MLIGALIMSFQLNADIAWGILIVIPFLALAVNMTTLLVVWISGRQIMVGNMEVGTLTAFITYLSQILTALNFMANIFLQETRSAASDRRISEVLNTVPEISDDHATKKEHKIESGSIEFRNVSFRYFTGAGYSFFLFNSLKV